MDNDSVLNPMRETPYGYQGVACALLKHDTYFLVIAPDTESLKQILAESVYVLELDDSLFKEVHVSKADLGGVSENLLRALKDVRSTFRDDDVEVKITQERVEAWEQAIEEAESFLQKPKEINCDPEEETS